MTFDLSYAPMDLSSTLRRAVCLATGGDDYVGGDGDPVDPNDVRMGKVFAIHDLVAIVGGVLYIGIFAAEGGPDGTSAVFWYNAATGAEAANGTDFGTGWGQFAVEVVGQ